MRGLDVTIVMLFEALTYGFWSLHFIVHTRNARRLLPASVPYLDPTPLSLRKGRKQAKYLRITTAYLTMGLAARLGSPVDCACGRPPAKSAYDSARSRICPAFAVTLSPRNIAFKISVLAVSTFTVCFSALIISALLELYLFMVSSSFRSYVID